MNTVKVTEVKPQKREVSVLPVGAFFTLTKNGNIGLRLSDGYFNFSSGVESSDVYAYAEELPKDSTISITIGTPIYLAFYQTETVENFLRAGKKIDAIKYVREVTGAGLKESKEFVDSVNIQPDSYSMESVLGKNESRQDESPW